ESFSFLLYAKLFSGDTDALFMGEKLKESAWANRSTSSKMCYNRSCFSSEWRGKPYDGTDA
ncbi:hypothetical protein, partial [Brevibacillus parabrevis]|uniref:hypothetical protein n=1 Tax=Brevibacillus parabrevis TaxID=54914 RepID=UPI001E347D86